MESSASPTTSESTSSASEPQAQVSEAAPEVKEQAPAPNLKKYKIKVDGEEFEEALDLSDDEAIRRHLQMGKAASKRMDQAQRLKKEMEGFQRKFDENPIEALLEKFGEERVLKMTEEHLSKYVSTALMSPQEREAFEMKQKLAQYEQSEQKRVQELQEQRTQALQAHYAQKYTQDITEALEVSGLPKNAYTVRRMAEFMKKNISHGLELSPKDIAQLVKNDFIEEQRSLAKDSSAEQLLSLLGEDVANKIRKKDLERLRAGNPFLKESKETFTPKPEKTGPLSMDEWREYVNKRVQS